MSATRFVRPSSAVVETNDGTYTYQQMSFDLTGIRDGEQVLFMFYGAVIEFHTTWYVSTQPAWVGGFGDFGTGFQYGLAGVGTWHTGDSLAPSFTLLSTLGFRGGVGWAVIIDRNALVTPYATTADNTHDGVPFSDPDFFPLPPAPYVDTPPPGGGALMRGDVILLAFAVGQTNTLSANVPVLGHERHSWVDDSSRVDPHHHVETMVAVKRDAPAGFIIDSDRSTAGPDPYDPTPTVSGGIAYVAYFRVPPNEPTEPIWIPGYCLSGDDGPNSLVTWMLHPSSAEFDLWSELADASNVGIRGPGMAIGSNPYFEFDHYVADPPSTIYDFAAGVDPIPFHVIADPEQFGTGPRVDAEGAFYYSTGFSPHAWYRRNPDTTLDTLTTGTAGPGAFDVDDVNDRLVLVDFWRGPGTPPEDSFTRGHLKLVQYDLATDVASDLLANVYNLGITEMGWPNPAISDPDCGISDLAIRTETGEVAIVFGHTIYDAINFPSDPYRVVSTLALMDSTCSTLVAYTDLSYLDGNVFGFQFDPVNDGWWWGHYPTDFGDPPYLAEVWFADAETRTPRYVATMPGSSGSGTPGWGFGEVIFGALARFFFEVDPAAFLPVPLPRVWGAIHDAFGDTWWTGTTVDAGTVLTPPDTDSWYDGDGFPPSQRAWLAGGSDGRRHFHVAIDSMGQWWVSVFNDTMTVLLDRWEIPGWISQNVGATLEGFLDIQHVTADHAHVVVIADHLNATFEHDSIEMAVFDLTGTIVHQWSIPTPAGPFDTHDQLSQQTGSCLGDGFAYFGVLTAAADESVVKVELATGTMTNLFTIDALDASIPALALGEVNGIVEIDGDLIIAGNNDVARVRTDGTIVWWGEVSTGYGPFDYRSLAHSGRGSVFAGFNTIAEADEWTYDGVFVRTLPIPEETIHGWLGP